MVHSRPPLVSSESLGVLHRRLDGRDPDSLLPTPGPWTCPSTHPKSQRLTHWKPLPDFPRPLRSWSEDDDGTRLEYGPAGCRSVSGPPSSQMKTTVVELVSCLTRPRLHLHFPAPSVPCVLGTTKNKEYYTVRTPSHKPHSYHRTRHRPYPVL